MSALESLQRLAYKRVAAPQHTLCDYVRKELGGLRFDQFLVPEPFTLGYHTPLYAELGEDERLALNHWVYSLMYTRISDGEEYVCQANAVLAEFVRPHSPVIADLIAREASEEHDHIPAFRMLKDRINEHYGIDPSRYPKKYARGLLLSTGTIRTLLKVFGVDYVITYFLGRGVANHMGMGFERPVAADSGDNAAIRRVSLLHTQDESQHMAVSHLMSAAAREFLPSGGRGAVYRRMRRKLMHSAAYYTFAESMSKTLERKMCHLVVPRLGPLTQRSPEFVRELVDTHFASVSGIERSRNKTLGKQNRRLLEEAALETEDRVLWHETLVSNQANLRFVTGEADYAQRRGCAAAGGVA